MHPTRPQQSIINELTGHASLLLSNTTPTIINSSPLQTNTNNTGAQTNSNTNTNNTLVVNFSDDDLIPEDSINFKKPQNEIFKKLDGKIQKIVAAHSNLNKLYALNDFSGAGPRKPFELPPQLPRPPPWVPKVASDYGCSQWAEDTLNNLDRIHPEEMEDNFRPRLSIPGSNRVTRIGPKMEPREISSPPTKQPPLTLDSAISRLHQRRQLEQNPQLHKVLLRPLNKTQSVQQKFQVPQPQPRISQQAQRIHQLNVRPQPKDTPNAVRELFPGPSRSNSNLAQFSSKDIGALNALIRAQKQQQLQQTSPPRESTGPTSIKPNLTPEERRKFQMELINIFRQEIAAVTKLAKLKFQSPQRDDRQNIADQNSLLLKKSPQSLFNTIRRETSLLLNRRESNPRSGTSLLSEQQGRLNYGQPVALRPAFNRFQSMKVVLPPSEHFKHVCGKQPSGKDGAENSNCKCFESKAKHLDMDLWCPSQQFTIEYRNLQMKLYQLKYVQRKDEFDRNRGISISMMPADARRRTNNPQKSLDNIVGRLQAKCMSSTSSSPVNQESHDQSSRISSPAPDSSSRVSQKLETFSPPQSPKPIPVFRSLTNKSGFVSGTTMNSNQRAINLKAKRLHYFGLRLGNYMEKDSAQPTSEKITVEQFAKCLNLVRTNDASLKRHQEKLRQSESRWRVPIGDRPLRLRRIRGDRVHMPASVSYKASRRVGLQ